MPVAVDSAWRLDLSSVAPADAERALMLWANTPGNPAGALDDLASVARWGREHQVAVFSDECYAEFTWQGPPRTILGHGGGADGLDGVVAVHSLSKRSNLAGLRVGWYAGDPDLVGYLKEVRKHAGLMVPGPAQRAAVAALADAGHVEEQRERYRARLRVGQEVLRSVGSECALPDGGFYLWAPVPERFGDEWEFTDWLAREGGALVSPGTFYGPAGADWGGPAAARDVFLHAQLGLPVVRRQISVADFLMHPVGAPDLAAASSLAAKLGHKHIKREMTAGVAGAGLVLLLVGGTLSLRWFGRLV